MVEDRYREWVAGSRYLTHVHPMLVDLANGLGILDVRLIKLDENPRSLFPDISGIIEMPLDLEHRTLSLLWVLGAYELIRTLAQRVKAQPKLMSPDATNALEKLKLTLARLRMPLAKLERAHRGEETDFSVAFPVLDGTSGIAWRIGPGDHISRRDVADQLVQLLSLAGVRPNNRLKLPTRGRSVAEWWLRLRAAA